MLKLSNLSPGVYTFKLTVMDAKGLQDLDSAQVFVKKGENIN